MRRELTWVVQGVGVSTWQGRYVAVPEAGNADLRISEHIS